MKTSKNILLDLIDLVDDIEFNVTYTTDSWVLRLPKHPEITFIIHQGECEDEEAWISWNNLGKVELYYGSINEMVIKLKNIIHEEKF